MTLIRLTGPDGRLVLVNIAYIVIAQPQTDGTRIHLRGAVTVDVQETTIEIQEQAWEQLQITDAEGGQ